MKFEIQQIRDNKKWGDLILLSNGNIELEIPTVIGPRITAFLFIGRNNIFYEEPEINIYFRSREWFPYGGHRLWHAPEVNPRSYYPDNQPVKIEQTENTLSIIQDIEETTNIQNIIRIHLETNGQNVHIDHILINKGIWPIELAGWAISMMGPGGKAVIPLPEKIPFSEELQPNHSIIAWPYTNLDDERIRISNQFIAVDQNPQTQLPIKIGAICQNN